MQVFWFIFFTVLGLLIASFLNVCIDRLPKGLSIVRPPSHCDSCQRRLAAGDMIPVYSYLRARGKCRYCGAAIPQRVLWVEICTGVLFALFFWKYGLTVDFAITAFYTCVFTVLLVIDLETKLILNTITYPMMGIALLISLLHPATVNPSLMFDFTGSNILNGGLSSLAGGAAAFVIFFLIAVISGGMGAGDVKMAGLIGLAAGFPIVFIALLIAVLTGGVVAIILLAFRIKKRKEGIPFGPFLAVGAVTGLIFGSQILNWYLNFTLF